MTFEILTIIGCGLGYTNKRIDDVDFSQYLGHAIKTGVGPGVDGEDHAER